MIAQPAPRLQSAASPEEEAWLALTPAGALRAFARPEPDLVDRCLQGILSSPDLPRVQEWVQRAREHATLLSIGLERGWLHRIARPLHAPDTRLDEFLPHLIAGLSGERRAALASSGGFCVGCTGYAFAEAEKLCVAATDFTDFARRQRARGWESAGGMAAFHEDAAMIMPSVSFVPFWVDGVDYCLVLGGEPLVNNPAIVELIWGLKTRGRRFDRYVEVAG